MSFLQAQIAQLIQLAKKKSEEEPYHEVLQYITLDGTQYFDTGLPTADGMSFEAGFVFTGTSSVSNGLFGGRHDTGRRVGDKTIWTGYELRRVGSSTYTQTINQTQLGQVTSSQNIAIGTYYDMRFSGTSLKLNNTTLTIEQGTSIETPMSIYIGAINNDGSAAVPISGKIYYFKIYNSTGELIRDYVPALDNQMKACLYDKISKSFIHHYNSSGTTEPTYERWNKYEVDYISFTGTQRISTGILPQPAVKVDTIFRSSYTAQTACCLFGGRVNSSGSDKKMFAVWQAVAGSNSNPDAAYVRADFGNTSTSSSGIGKSYLNENWTNLVKDGADNYLNGEQKESNSVTTFTVASDSIDIQIGCMGNGTTTSANYGNYFQGDIKEFQMWVDGTLVRNFKPSVRIYNDGTDIVTKAFLYDEVYNKAYDNAGTESFKAYLIGYGNVFTRTGETAGKFIDADGNIQTNSNSAYSALLPIKGGETVTCVSGTASNNNYRYHVYDSSGTWIEQALALNPPTTTAVTGSFVAPSNASYVRVSYPSASSSNIIEVNSSRATYEVGKSVSATPSASISGVSNCFDTGLYGTQNTTVKHIAIGYDSNSTAGQLFGSYDGSTETSQNLTINSTGTGNTAPIRFDGQVITTAIKIPTNTFASIVTSRYGLWVNDSLHGTWGDVNDFTTTTTMLILKCNNSTNTRNNGCGYCLILEKDVPVAEFIPVRNASNTSVYGLYDKVSKTLNTGEGTINFNVLD